MENGATVHDHVFKMIGLIKNMEKLGHPYSREMATDIILLSLSDSFNQFIMNFNMSEVDKTLNELHAMLISAEKHIPKNNKKDVLMVQKGKGFKKEASKKSKGKKIAKALEKPKSTLKPKVGVASECFYYKNKGH
ncbi:uncharacterized protein LOC110694395 [Chenopodium quinoa]|uniref:uncharacterized protein LOC110694395 n=1 Tax=Chenopodium quinoa TaxID=63459 RepID=UPI000B786ACF|nr:uncharacterized protein LOC110694395 [Chenopodium quinoa]